MQQIVDLHSDTGFQAMDVALLSIAFDSAEEQRAGIEEYGIRDVPMLIDANGDVSRRYDVLKWAVASGEPGHTFILVDQAGRIAWIRDYGSPTLPDPVMYVDPNELVEQISEHLQ
jgi:peroxiredoxin